MSFETFVEDYYLKIAQLTRGFDKMTMPRVLDILTRVLEAGGTVWVAGNLISYSGNSPNLVKACEYANSGGAPAVTGFLGGRLRELGKIFVWNPVDNYGIMRNLRQSLIHA